MNAKEKKQIEQAVKQLVIDNVKSSIFEFLQDVADRDNKKRNSKNWRKRDEEMLEASMAEVSGYTKVLDLLTKSK